MYKIFTVIFQSKSTLLMVMKFYRMYISVINMKFKFESFFVMIYKVLLLKEYILLIFWEFHICVKCILILFILLFTLLFDASQSHRPPFSQLHDFLHCECLKQPYGNYFISIYTHIYVMYRDSFSWVVRRAPMLLSTSLLPCSLLPNIIWHNHIAENST